MLHLLPLSYVVSSGGDTLPENLFWLESALLWDALAARGKGLPEFFGS